MSKEEKKQTPPVEVQEEGYVYAKDHKKSMREIMHELSEKAREPEVVEPAPIEPPKEEDKPVEKAPEIDVSRVAEEAAEKAAQKASAEFKAEMEKIAEGEKSKIEKEKAMDEMTAIWDKEGRLPTDYKEIFNEAQRIATVNAKKVIEEEKGREREQAETARKQQEEKQTAEQKMLEERNKVINSKIESELELLYSLGHMPKIEKVGDENDKGEQAKKALFELGIKINTERTSKGEAPIDSIAKIYTDYYKPLIEKGKQPAGADAPIAGNRTSRPTNNEGGYNYAKDHNKSYRQIIMESMK